MNNETDFIDSITKRKIPKEYAYVLKSSQFNKLLSDNNILIHVDLVYCGPKSIASIFEAHYWFPNENVPYCRLYIRTSALLKEDAIIARELMVNEVFPHFIKWADALMKQPGDWAMLIGKPIFYAVFKDSMVEINSSN